MDGREHRQKQGYETSQRDMLLDKDVTLHATNAQSSAVHLTLGGSNNYRTWWVPLSAMQPLRLFLLVITRHLAHAMQEVAKPILPWNRRKTPGIPFIA